MRFGRIQLALRWLGGEMARRHGLHVQIQAGEPEPAIADEIKTLLFESIREMLFNVVKHAEATKQRLPALALA